MLTSAWPHALETLRIAKAERQRRASFPLSRPAKRLYVSGCPLDSGPEHSGPLEAFYGLGEGKGWRKGGRKREEEGDREREDREDEEKS